MRFGLNAGYSGARMQLQHAADQGSGRTRVSLGVDGRGYGSDAVTAATWVAAQTETIHVATGIMQMPARTPAMTAMTATTLDQLSGGRFLSASARPGRRWSRAGTASPTASR
jgi:alkanesulfonate monooxygenase SsuD/methylene tetrahydromethanopterin reductase-like flavin-dependent oxidoreductase (luciferase family)